MEKRRRIIKYMGIVLCFIFSWSVCMISCAEPANASEKIETIQFAWIQEGGENFITQWEMHWSETAGGPYVHLTYIPYNPPAQINYYSSVEAVVTGSPNTIETRYFVLKNCGNVINIDNTTQYECGGWSNEVSYDFEIPWTGFSAPLQFKIITQ